MKVLVTGGAGNIGRVVVDRLLKNGHQVRALDTAPKLDLPGVEYINGNITDYDTVRAAVKGCDSVAHLAALRAPTLGTGPEVYNINTTGTFNVYEAAAAEGIKRVAQASSINALGCAWNTVDVDIRYFPVDEEHPTATTDPYSLSKQVGESIGDYYWRRDGISGVSLRFPWVYPEEYGGSETWQARRKGSVALIEELLGLPEADVQTRMARARQSALDFRIKRRMEEKNFGMSLEGDPLVSAYTIDRFNFWVSLDVRDAAQSFEKGLTADYEGHHPLYVNAASNWLHYDTNTLLRLFYPEVTRFKRPLAGSEAPVSYALARSLIGFEPAYSVAQANP
jgi:hypothetical protein